jgi:hypothetical protein
MKINIWHLCMWPAFLGSMYCKLYCIDCIILYVTVTIQIVLISIYYVVTFPEKCSYMKSFVGAKNDERQA